MGETVSLSEHLLALRECDIKYNAAIDNAQKSAVAAAFAAQKEAIAVAASDAAMWRASANEWRSAMNDREAKFATKSALDNVNLQVTKIEATLAATSGRGLGRGDMWGWLVGGVAIVGLILGLWLQ